MKRKLCVIRGDGIGPEVVSAAVKVLQVAMPEIETVDALAGWQVFEESGESVPQATLLKLRDCGAGIFGAVSSPSRFVPGYESAILKIRKDLELYANIRPIESRWSDHVNDDVNIVIVRENTEDLYIRDETSDGETAIAKRLITRAASGRIGRTAATVAKDFGYSNINVVHKANVLPKTDGLFRDSVFESIEQYAAHNNVELEIDQSLVDIAAYRLASNPDQFEVIVTTNMFGDILSDLAAHWCGGMGRAPSLNLGDGIALAEPVHGSAPDIAGQGIADPTAAILSATLLCRLHWNEPQVADAIETALFAASNNSSMEQPGTPQFTTDGFTERVISCLTKMQPTVI